MLNRMIAKNTLSLNTFFEPERTGSRPLRITLAILYTAVLTLLLVQSSAHPVIGPVAPREFNLAWEILLTLAHVVGFALLVIVQWGALASGGAHRWALIVTVLFSCLLGLSTELFQSIVPDRSASLFDLAVNWGITLLVARQITVRRRGAVLQ